jgi:NCAIR mutase (PurE)-related protein
MDKAAILDYQEARKEEIAEEEKLRREKDDKKRFEEQFLAAGGASEDVDREWKNFRRESAAETARRADQDAAQRARQTAFGGV